MFGLGFSVILALMVIVMVLFGSKKIPELGSSLALGIRNFQKGIKGEPVDPPKIENQNQNQNQDKIG